ncbi:MAG: hypothetical protein IPM74_12825 [Crocinitomicaceae bacterium]|nr:hypothetical protein [Crocinitomicaceae bacterium]MBK8926757.1 hypothetical protein [Crocinitomicaceae bacterium]
MKRTLLFFFPVAIITACSGSSESGVGSSESDVSGNADTTQVFTYDTSSAEAFISTFNESRISMYPSDFEISGECILENGFFRIINFSETMGNYSSEYCIVMNPLEKIITENTDNETFNEVQQIITNNNFTMNLYQGNLAPIYYDLKGDGSEDFQLTMDESYRTDFHITHTIVLYDGNNGLEKTAITARTNCVAGELDDFSGIMENFEFKKKGKNLPQIILTHKEHDFKPDPSYQTGIGNFEYTLTWQWSLDSDWGAPEWETSFKGNYENCKSAIDEFSKPRFRLSEEYEGYAILENCHAGGPEHFVLYPFSDDYGSNYYIPGDNTGGIGNNVLLCIFEQETQYTLVFGYSEKFEANTSGDRYLGNDTYIRFISKRGESDIESHWGISPGTNSFYTVDTSKYPLAECEGY